MAENLAPLRALARLRLLAGLSVVLAFGCGGDAGRAPAASATASGATAASAAPPTSAAPDPGETVVTAWAEARALEPAALATLAHQAGAARLVEALDHPENGAAARAALAHARDADLAIGPLARRARAGGPSAEAELEALVAVLSRTERMGERLDPDGEASAVADLSAIADDAARPTRTRGLAGTALGRLTERGVR